MDRRDTNHKWYHHFDKERMIISWEGGDGETVEIKAQYEVCGTCDGKGKHVNPSIDAHGISAEEFAEDPDFAEDYFRGRYDIPCNECHGERVVPVVSDDESEENKKRAQDKMDDWYAYQQEIDYERRMGC